ncbi:Ger(x)C family spore germination protein [Ectobacillus sp. JY-23]|uniref:Ger(x)C family spore germination protein n=1 Tax=Ectobacillus sp. JY-23 TaxID=2933872 RepID=UPI001FF20171|nr:Ger(x)C family spore germination protein [Ectobacillus sp. JY-23]UOY93587.1 Ger(x)C family spore germination protein [Ectobacillus sp. JY-23]
MKVRIFILIHILLLTSCVSPKVIDELPVIFVVGYDSEVNKKMKATVASQVFNRDQSSSIYTYTASSHTSKGLRNQLSAIQKPITIGKIAVILFSEEMAFEGIERILDSYLRDATVGRLVTIAIVEGGSAHDLVKYDYGYPEGLGPHIKNLINKSVEFSNFPRTNLHLYDYMYRGEGMDPYVPLITKKGDKIQLRGLALFKNDKMVEKLNLEDTFVFNLMNEKSDIGVHELKVNHSGYASLQQVSSNVKYRIENHESVPTVYININVKGSISEYSGLQINTKVEHMIQKALERKIEHKGRKLMERFQSLKIDPLCIGDRVRSQTRQFNVTKWHQIYPTAKIVVKANVQISGSGVVR